MNSTVIKTNLSKNRKTKAKMKGSSTIDWKNREGMVLLSRMRILRIIILGTAKITTR
jgi:hypothetical protein